MVFKFLRELSQFLIVKVRVIAGLTTFPVSTLFVVVAFTLFFSITSCVIEAFCVESGLFFFELSIRLRLYIVFTITVLGDRNLYKVCSVFGFQRKHKDWLALCVSNSGDTTFVSVWILIVKQFK